MSINGKAIDVEVDTGAPLSVISEATYRFPHWEATYRFPHFLHTVGGTEDKRVPEVTAF